MTKLPSNNNKQNKQTSCKEEVQRIIPILTDLLRNVNYGYIHLKIHDGKVVQIDKTEKYRLDNQAKAKRDPETSSG